MRRPTVDEIAVARNSLAQFRRFGPKSRDYEYIARQLIDWIECAEAEQREKVDA